MLAIDCCMHLAAEEVFEGDNLRISAKPNWSSTRSLTLRRFDGCTVPRATGEGFDLDCGLAPPHLDACVAAATAGYPLCPGRR